MITHDLDFGAILAATGGDGPSVVQVRCQALLSDEVENLLLEALDACADELLRGALVVLDANRARVRVLPLRSA